MKLTLPHLSALPLSPSAWLCLTSCDEAQKRRHRQDQNVAMAVESLLGLCRLDVPNGHLVQATKNTRKHCSAKAGDVLISFNF